MSVIQPYLKYILYLISIIGVVVVNAIFVRDLTLRKWLMSSFEDETGRTDSKKLSGFLCVVAVVIGWFIAIHYGKDHTPPEWYFWGMVSLIAALYGIREVGKVYQTKYSAPFSNGSTTTDSYEYKKEEKVIVKNEKESKEKTNDKPTS